MSDEMTQLVESLAEYFIDSVLAVKTLQPQLDIKTTNGYKVLVEFLESKVKDNQTIKMVLPAFPSEMPNWSKTLSTSSDFCEFAALKRMTKICQHISEIYEPGAHVTLFSNYHTFQVR